MAQQRKRPAQAAGRSSSPSARGSASRAPRRTASGRKPANARRRRRKTSLWQQLMDAVTRYRAEKSEFRPDAQENPLVKSLHITQQQRIRLLRWTLLSLVCVLCLVLQDCIMSRIKLFGATTDLAVAAILLVCVMEGSETGSIFALIASVVYFYSGSAPTPYCVALITIPGLLCGLFRQKYWHFSGGSVFLCSAIAMLVYELGLFLIALFGGLTRWDRVNYFLLTAAYSIAWMIPLFQLIYRIGKMGGYVWKE